MMGSDRCTFCGNIQTLAHILSNCNVALDQGRLTWRHNSVLSNIIALIRPHLVTGMHLFSDLPGFMAPGGGSIPPNVLPTNLRPDIVIVNEASGEVVLGTVIFHVVMILRRKNMLLWSPICRRDIGPTFFRSRFLSVGRSRQITKSA